MQYYIHPTLKSWLLHNWLFITIFTYVKDSGGGIKKKYQYKGQKLPSNQAQIKFQTHPDFPDLRLLDCTRETLLKERMAFPQFFQRKGSLNGVLRGFRGPPVYQWWLGFSDRTFQIYWFICLFLIIFIFIFSSSAATRSGYFSKFVVITSLFFCCGNIRFQVNLMSGLCKAHWYYQNCIFICLFISSSFRGR